MAGAQVLAGVDGVERAYWPPKVSLILSVRPFCCTSPVGGSAPSCWSIAR